MKYKLINLRSSLLYSILYNNIYFTRLIYIDFHYNTDTHYDVSFIIHCKNNGHDDDDRDKVENEVILIFVVLILYLIIAFVSDISQRWAKSTIYIKTKTHLPLN